MLTFNKTVLASTVLALGFAIPAGHAEDIDIYAAPRANSDNPNVLIVIDNSANWNRNDQAWPGGIKQGQAELNAIRTVINELGADINVGLMMLTEGSGTNVDGGYVRFDIRPMDSTNKTAFRQQLGNPAGCAAGANSVSTTPNCIYQNFNSNAEQVGSGRSNYSHALFEAFKYFGGYTSPANAKNNVAGNPQDRTHFGTARHSGNPDSKSDPAAYVNGTTDPTKAFHNPPIDPNNPNCAKNYIIFIGNGFPSGDAASSLLSGVGGNTAKLPLPNFTEGTGTIEEQIETTTCGTYASVAACESAAAAAGAAATTAGNTGSLYYGYTSFRCTVANTCSAGATSSITTDLGIAACGIYSSATDCQNALPGLFPGYTSYSCTAGSACSYTQGIAPTVIDNQASCVPNSVNNEAACISWAAGAYPNYSGFSCTNPVRSTCQGNDRKWVVSATQQVLSGNTYSMNGTITTTVSTSSDSHSIFGTRTITGITPTGTSSIPTDQDNNWADEWTRFLFQTDVSAAPGQQNVKTFAIDVIRRYTNPTDDDQTKLMMSMAQAGGGKYFNAQDEQAIANALRKIFAEIQSVSSVFASSSLPVSVNTQGTYLNQVFVGMFRPDAGAGPRWAGNLKQYQLKFFGDALNLADKRGEQAISSTTGFITPCASSLWSTDTGTYWNYPNSLAVGTCTDTNLASNFPSPGSPSTFSDSPDGDVVEKGGAAQKLRGTGVINGSLITSTTRYAACGTGESPLTHTCRAVKTCTGSCAGLVEFTTASSGLDSNLVDWVRGKDVDNENGNLDGGGAPVIAEVRPSVHGGVIHSQPAVIDYGGATGVVAFYGADDGMLHAVDGGKSDAEGQEFWAFIAPETYSKFNRLRDNGVNTPLINFPGITGNVAPKDYFFDGSIGVLQNAAAGLVWIYPTMRRGGRAVYAFDVSDPTAPILKWRRGCFTSSTTDDSNCSTGWSAIGQTWSKPQIGYLPGYVTTDGQGNVVKKPVLVFGGGYDTCEDTDSQTRCTGTPRKGANIWFIDADTGAILRTYATQYSVPGEVALIQGADGYLDYVYASDTGGNLYRINVGTIAIDVTTSGLTFSGWTSNGSPTDIQIAALSETSHSRKFLFGPDVFSFLDSNFVVVGSGDREHPLFTNYICNVRNQIYVVKDTLGPQSAADTTAAQLIDITNGTTTVLDDPTVNGWKYNLNTCEQTVNKALVAGGKIFIGTNQAVDQTNLTACTNNLGIARGYTIDFATGTTSVNEYEGGGLPPSPVAGVVQMDDGTKVPFCIGCGGGDSALESAKIPVTPPPTRSRIYWYLQND